MNENCGVVAIRNLKTDRVYLFYSNDIKGDCVKSRFQLDLGMHSCRSLQEDYASTGLEVFRFDVIEETDNPARLSAIKESSKESGLALYE